MLANKKEWKIIVNSYSCSNAIRLIVFLITGKWVNSYFYAFCLFRIWFWKRQHDQFHTKIDKFSFFSPRIWSVLWMRFSLHRFKKWGDDPEITKKLYFSFIFGVENMPSPNIRGCPLINSFKNPRCLRMLYGSVVSCQFYKDHKWYFGSNTVKLIFNILGFFLNIYFEKFWVVCFQLIFVLLIFSFIYWFCIMFCWVYNTSLNHHAWLSVSYIYEFCISCYFYEIWLYKYQ